MTPIIHGVGITHGIGDGLLGFPSDLADAGTAGSAAAFSVQASDISALITLACFIRGSDASALPMRVLLAVSEAAVADSIDQLAGPTGRSAAKAIMELSLCCEHEFRTDLMSDRMTDSHPAGRIPTGVADNRCRANPTVCLGGI